MCIYIYILVYIYIYICPENLHPGTPASPQRAALDSAEVAELKMNLVLSPNGGASESKNPSAIWGFLDLSN